MQRHQLAVIVQWSWGGRKVLLTHSDANIGKTLEKEGFCAIDSSQQLIIAFKGALIDPNFSFMHYHITKGSKLVVFLKKIPSKKRSQQFLASLNQREEPRTAFSPLPETNDSIRREEIARLNDLSFSSWEAMPEFPTIMNDILSQQDEQYGIVSPAGTGGIFFPTNITPAKEINEDPLPSFLNTGNLGQNGALRNGFGFNNSNLLSEPRNGLYRKKHE